MILSSMAVLPLLLALQSGSAPPHAPNFCTQAFCLELQPMLHTQRKGFVKIEKDLFELDGQTWARFKYGDLGTVSVRGPFVSSAKANSVNYDAASEEIVVNSCASELKNGQTCHRYLITVSDNKLGKKTTCLQHNELLARYCRREFTQRPHRGAHSCFGETDRALPVTWGGVR